MSVEMEQKTWTEPTSGRYMLIEIGTDGSVEFNITDPEGGPYRESWSLGFRLEPHLVNELREALS